MFAGKWNVPSRVADKWYSVHLSTVKTSSHSSTIQKCSDNSQPCINGMELGNNDIADNTACSLIHLRHWLPYAVFSFNSWCFWFDSYNLTGVSIHWTGLLDSKVFWWRHINGVMLIISLVYIDHMQLHMRECWRTFVKAYCCSKVLLLLIGLNWCYCASLRPRNVVML